MNTLLVKLGRVLLSVILGASAGSALALPSIGTQLDNYCAQQPLQTSAPQQSRPFQASGSSCLLCHTSANASVNNLNTLGTASRSCVSGACSSAVNSACVAHPPSGASITAPPAGTTVAQGQSLTFAAASAINPDGFPLAYTWLFTGGMPSASGQSVSVPMTVAGTITSTLRVSNSVGMLASGTPPTRSVTVTGAALPALTASPSSLAFTAQAGGSSLATQTVSVTSSGSAVNVSATAATSSGGNWLSVSPASAATPSTYNISVNPASLAAGTYSGTVTFSGTASNSPRTVAVTFTVTGGSQPALTASPSSLAFTAQAGGSSPAAQTISVASSGTAVNVSATAATSSGGNWLSVTPASAATPSTFHVAVNLASLAAGTYSGTVTFSGAASNSPQSVAVTLTVTSAGNPSFTATIVAPAINVSVLPGGKVTFSGSGSGSSNLPLRYKWSFPGASPKRSTRQKPGVVVYGRTGTYTATLTVTDSKGVVSAPATRVITVAPANQTPRVPSNDCMNSGENGGSHSTPTPIDD